jgi:predicted phage terminase large subunit-like protein
MAAKRKPAVESKFSALQMQVALDQAARDDFRIFTKVIHLSLYGTAFDEAPFHDMIFSQYERIYRGEVTRAIQVLPPRSGKTFINAAFQVWTLGRHRDSLYIGASYAEPLALVSSALVQQMVRDPTYLRLFPGVEVDPKSSALDKWTTTDGAGFRWVGVGGGVTGFGVGRFRPGSNEFGGILTVDDLLKIGEARSQIVRDTAWEFLSASLMSRRNSPRTPVIVTAQRAHGDDPIGRLLDGGLGEWDYIRVPGLDDKDRSFWPARKPASEYIQQRDIRPFEFWTQTQGLPQDPSGAVFKMDRIEVLDHAPAFKGRVKYCRGWDFAGTAGAGDATCSVLMAVTEDRVYVLDYTQDRIAHDEVKALVLACARRDPEGVIISIPQDPASSGKAVARDFVKLLRGFDAHVSTEDKSKFNRALPFAAQVNGYAVSAIEHPKRLLWQNELTTFDSGPHDDFVDCSSRAFAELAELLGSDKEIAERREAYRAQLQLRAISGDQAARDEISATSDSSMIKLSRAAERASIRQTMAERGANCFNGEQWKSEPDGWLPPGYYEHEGRIWYGDDPDDVLVIEPLPGDPDYADPAAAVQAAQAARAAQQAVQDRARADALERHRIAAADAFGLAEGEGFALRSPDGYALRLVPLDGARAAIAPSPKLQNAMRRNAVSIIATLRAGS